MIFRVSVIAALAATFCVRAADVSVVPRPAQVEPRPGEWSLSAATRVVAAGGGAAAEVRKLAREVSLATGWDIPVVMSARPGDISLALDAARKDLGAEGYELVVEPGGVRIVSAAPAGLFYAGVTLRQLLPAAAWRKAPAGEVKWTAACVQIVDQPRFAWRGLLLDPARHFLPKSTILEMLDAMAMHKLNRLQLHLTDDQGWRLELKGFPRMTARSSWRDGTLTGGEPERYSPVPHGGFYSQEDIREIIAYARARHIVVVPEVEMPGHTGAWLAAYPEFAVFPDRAAKMDVVTHWGVSKNVLAPRPATVEACRRILDEVCELFPSEWIHIGGDEAPRDLWKESAEMQALIRKLGVRDEDGLQAWFTAELSRHLAAKGRRLVGWDEILAGAELGGAEGRTGLASNAIVMSWRGEEGGKAAARAGHDVIMTPYEWTYLDYYQGPPAEEPLSNGGSVSLARAYRYEPVPEGVPESAARHVLGSQAQVWGEPVPDSDTAFQLAFPRAAALSEAFWTPRERKDLTDFLGRLDIHEQRLRAAGIAYHPLARRTALPGSSGTILMRAKEAVVLGTDVKREPDGPIAGWKDPFTMLCWRAQLQPGEYRVSIAAGGMATEAAPALEIVVAGNVLRPIGRAAGSALPMGVVTVPRPGAYLVFLRTTADPGQGAALPTIRGVEMSRQP